MKKKSLYILLGLVIVAGLAGIFLYPKDSDDIVITTATGKTIEQVRKEHAQYKFYQGVTPDKLYLVSFYEDPLAADMFYFTGGHFVGTEYVQGTCLREVIIPLYNEHLLKYITWLNKHAMPYNEGGLGGMTAGQSDATDINKNYQGRWRLIDNGHITNIVLECGEGDRPCYFINTDELPGNNQLR